jgi:predicted ArsR family transcriptional regulator
LELPEITILKFLVPTSEVWRNGVLSEKEKKLQQKVNMLNMAVMNWCRWASLVLRYTLDTYGEEALDGLKRKFKESGRKVGPLTQRALRIEEQDATAMAKIVDMGDEAVDIQGEWTELSAGKAVKIEKVCPIARGLREAPEFCGELIPAFMEGELEGMGIPFRAVIAKNLAKGDSVCEIVIEPKE